MTEEHGKLIEAIMTERNLKERLMIYWRTWRGRGAAKMSHWLWLHWALLGRYPL